MIQETIAPLGHTIIALSAAVDATEAINWATYLNNVSDAIEQRPAILIVPFSNVDDAQAFAAIAPVKTNYRFVAACYNGAFDQVPEIAATVAAALADSNDPAVPFNGYNLAGLKPVDDQYKLTWDRTETALRAGVCMIATGADGVPEIVRAMSTYQANPANGDPDDIVADINGALVLDYTRKVVRQAVRKNGRRKNTVRQRKNLRSLILVELLKLDDAEILQNVRERANELRVLEDKTDRSRVNVQIPADWVRGMHVIAATLDVY
ncbi:phage tail sheath C-terminal domain-containing protein [Acinetobacter modestus]|uniref:phage tail sheath C-terminal domain-containing protein n=1 Tax=Acinetobacter modestus TaxID=1776740 RepID=UPI00301AF9C4